MAIIRETTDYDAAILVIRIACVHRHDAYVFLCFRVYNYIYIYISTKVSLVRHIIILIHAYSGRESNRRGIAKP